MSHNNNNNNNKENGKLPSPRSNERDFAFGKSNNVIVLRVKIPICSTRHHLFADHVYDYDYAFCTRLDIEALVLSELYRFFFSVVGFWLIIIDRSVTPDFYHSSWKCFGFYSTKKPVDTKIWYVFSCSNWWWKPKDKNSYEYTKLVSHRISSNWINFHLIFQCTSIMHVFEGVCLCECERRRFTRSY